MPDSNPKPTIFLVHGGWHTPAHYEPLLRILRAHNYPVATIDLPTCAHPDSASKTIYDDIRAITSAIAAIADAGADVIVLMHSYGGFVGSDGVWGLGKVEREKEGRRGGVVKMVYVAAAVAEKGTKLVDLFGGEIPEYAAVDENNMTLPINPHNLFYSDLSPAESSKWASTLRPMPARIFHDPNEHGPPQDIPSVYVICTDDRAVPYEVQKWFASNVGDGCRVLEVESGHSPFLNVPERIVEIVEGG